MSNMYTKKDGEKPTKMDQEICDSSEEEYFADSLKGGDDVGSSSSIGTSEDSERKSQSKIKLLRDKKRQIERGDWHGGTNNNNIHGIARNRNAELKKSLSIVRRSITDNSEEKSSIKKSEVVSERGVVNIDSPLHASNLGMSFEQILDVQELLRQLYGPKALKSMTMRDVVELVVKPACKENKKCYALYRNADGLKASAFVTHTWDENFNTFVQSIESVFETTMKKPNLWICAFALYQGDTKDIEEQVGGHEQRLDESPFVQALKAAEYFVVVRNSTTDLYTRIWCVCELVFAMDYGMVPDKTFVTGPGTFENSTTSCLEAKAFSEDDRNRILGHLTSNRSPEEVDEMIQAFRSKGAPSRLLRKKSFLERYKWLILFFVTVAVLGLVTLSIFFATSEPQVSESPTSSFAPSMSPTTVDQGLVYTAKQTILKNFKAANETIMNDDSTQQYAAVHWIALSLDNSTSFSTKKILQLYSLASICAKNIEFLKTDDECKWDGAACDPDGNVISLNLSNRNLTGTLPSEIYLLSNKLSSLDLSGNFFSGFIPAEVFQLTMLSTLNISRNHLVGGISSTIRKATSLSTLDLSNNELTSTIPSEIGHLSMLQKMYLHDNSFSSKLPTELGKLVKLTTLNLQNNVFPGPLPSEIGLMSSLRVWNMANNSVFRKIPHELWQGNNSLPNLESLDLSHNLLTGDSGSDFDNFGLPWKKLKSLRLGNNLLRGSSERGSFYSLQDNAMNRFPNLEELDLSSNYFTGTVPVGLFEMTKLKVLDLANSGMKCDSNLLFQVASKVRSLEQLDLSRCNIEGSIPTEIGLMKNLTNATFDRNQLSGSIPSELGNLGNLESLSISNNQLRGSIPSELGNLGNLKILSLYNDVRGNQLSGSIPSELGNLGNLESLNLRRNGLSGSIPSELGNLDLLTGLQLDTNILSGSIPSELGDLDLLTYLHLDTNILSGSIPSELGNLDLLTYLNLESNRLSGSIPSELANLDLLTGLYLFANELSGSVPFSFCQRDKSPEIRVDCKELICHCCVPACTQYTPPSSSPLPSTLPTKSPRPTNAPIPRPSESVSPSWLPSNSKTPSSLPSPSPSTMPSKSQMPTQSTSPSNLPTTSKKPSWSPSQSASPSIFQRGPCPVVPEGGCSVCGEGECVQNMNAIVEVPGQLPMSCRVFEERSLNLSYEQCEFLRSAILPFISVCECGVPQSAPSSFKSMVPTTSPAPTISASPTRGPCPFVPSVGCSACGKGKCVQNMDAIVELPGSPPISCGEGEEIWRNAQVSNEVCEYWQLGIAFYGSVCECG